MASKTVITMQAVKHQLSCRCSGAMSANTNLTKQDNAKSIVNDTFMASPTRTELTRYIKTVLSNNIAVVNIKLNALYDDNNKPISMFITTSIPLIVIIFDFIRIED